MGMNRQDITRLAPSPTGALHLGNARTFLINWAIARKLNWRIVFRIEDLDTPRIKPEAVGDLADTLEWLGIDWDKPLIGPPENPLVQSKDLEPYRETMRILAERGLAYPCELTRAQIEAAASAPQEGSHETPFPDRLRPPVAGAPMDFDRIQADAKLREGTSTNWRFFCPKGEVPFDDRIAGNQSFDPSEITGDFVLWTKRDLPSYQLAVVVDDDRQGVTQVVRGDDLLDSGSRQLLLYRALDLGPEPAYWHLPLVIGTDGKRLAKRHGDTRIDHYREKGVPAEAVIGLIAHWSIRGAPRAPLSAAEFKDRFDPATMDREPVEFTSEDDAWLLSQAKR
jgi:glutamyl-tRNA synthetase